MYTSTLCTHLYIVICEGATDYNLQQMVVQQIVVQRCNRLCLCNVVGVLCMVSEIVYLSELLSHHSPPRPLRSQNSGHLIIPRISKSTTGGRSFFYLAPKLWNNLPNTVREADTLCQFKSRLKTHLFNLAYT